MCIGEQHSLKLSAAVQSNKNNHDGGDYENKAEVEKNKNYSFKKRKERV